ncbi:hypothetical protein [Siminovitchia fortis]|nr:hypothetical protein [Siminovitchia fortis]
MRDFLNKTTRHIVRHYLDNGIGKIVVGLETQKQHGQAFILALMVSL